MGKFWKTKCDITLRLVEYYAVLGVMLYAACYNVRVHVCSARVQCMCAERFVRG